MRKSLFALALLGIAGAANAQLTAVYSNTTTYTGGFAAGGATSTSALTKMLADDISFASGSVGSIVRSFSFGMVNYNSVAASARPLVRFYNSDGASGGPGTYITGLNFNPINLSATTYNVFTYTPAVTATGIFTVPTSNKIWVGIAFDNTGATATADQLNNFGLPTFNAPTVGSSADVFFVSTATGAAASSNPAGTFANFGGNPAGNFAFSFSVNPVPEPSTVAALGLGAVALLRRRKRA